MRYVSCAVIIVSCLAAGVLLGYGEREICRRLESVIKLIKYMRANITSFGTPLGELFATYSDARLDACGFIEQLNMPLGANGYSRNWDSAVRTLGFEPEIEADVLIAGERLGESDIKQQLERLEYCESILSQRLIELEKKLPSKMKSYKSLGALVGVLIAIILI